MDRDTLTADWIIITEMAAMRRRAALVRNVLSVLLVMGVAALSARAGLPLFGAFCTLLVAIPLLWLTTPLLLASLPSKGGERLGLAALANSTLRPTTRSEVTLTVTDTGVEFSGALQLAVGWRDLELTASSTTGELVLCIPEKRAFVIPRDVDPALQQQFLHTVTERIGAAR